MKNKTVKFKSNVAFPKPQVLEKPLIIFIILASSVFIYAQEYDDEGDFNVVRTSDGNSVIITGYTGIKHSVNIPPQIRQLPVSGIGVEAFKKKHLTNITIPNSITLINIRAFEDNQLAEINLPDSITVIGEYAFSGNLLTNVIIPDSVTIIGEGAFSGNQLTSVTISSNVTSIESYTFSGNQLTNIIIPESVSSIGEGAFSGNQLTRIIIGSHVSFYTYYLFIDGFELGFDQFYRNIGQKSGTYIYRNGSWGEDW